MTDIPIVAIAITAQSDQISVGELLSPCGSCRQIIHEYLGNIPIYISDSKGKKYTLHYIEELLPYPFE